MVQFREQRFPAKSIYFFKFDYKPKKKNRKDMTFPLNICIGNKKWCNIQTVLPIVMLFIDI